MAVDRDKLLQAAQKLVEKKRYDKAIAEYQKLVVDDPKDVRTLLKIGDLYLKMEQHVDAITTYERVGQFYSQQGFALKAIAVYKQIREIIHKHVPHMEDRFGHIVPRLAEIYAQLGLVSEALAAYDEVATRLQRSGRDRDAIDILRKVVDLDPQNPLPHLKLGEAFIRIKDVDNAIQCFGSAAEILLKQGRKDDALKVVERLLQHRADPKFARIAAEIYLDRGQPNDGMAALTKLQISFKDNPKDLDTLALLARAFDKLGQPAKAIEVQKESARIAKDAGKLDQFNALVDALLARAPNDDGVRLLGAHRAAAVQAATDARASIDIEVDEEVELDENDVESIHSQTPFALRSPSQGSIRPPAASTSHAQILDPIVRARQIIVQADMHRRGREYDLAIAVLIEGIEEVPDSRDLREKLCDMLIEAGDQPEAVRQMLSFARWLGAQGDLDGAARILDEVLLLEPGQPDALEALRAFGYSVGPDAYPASHHSIDYAPSVRSGALPVTEPAEDDYAAPAVVAPYAPYGSSPSDPNAPLPRYEFDDEPQNTHEPQQSAVYGVRSNFQPSQIDDPFADDGALPRFRNPALDDETTTFMQLPSARESNDFRGRHEAQGALSRPEPAAQLDEDALEEAEFFASLGQFDQARELIEEQLARLPNHPLLLERQRELEAMAAGHEGDASGTHVVPRSPLPPPFEDQEDRSFEIASVLDAIDELDALDASPHKPAASDDDQQISVESVFEQFKQGVAAQISPSDAATHYDLGVAYKEMGLFSDAIAEFELAARDPTRECVCQSMVGTIYLQLGGIDSAIDAFIRGLHAGVKTRDQEIALTYEIGDCYETRNAPDQALYYFQRVARIEPRYNDLRGSVADRIRRLEPATHRAAVNDPREVEGPADDFDAALDDILGSTDLP